MRTVFENGVTVVSEKVSYLRSVSLGIWVVGGSCADGEHNGIAHYAEHMAFKGTKTRTTNDIAKEFDAMGGDVNAFTAKEVTCYYAKMLDSHLYRCLELLSDMVLNPKYDETETNNERKVISEEIAMYEDSPDDLAMGRLSENVWINSPLGKEILGTAASVDRITPALLFENHSKHYTGANIVISACGSLDEDEFVNRCRELFGNTDKGERALMRYGTKYKPSLILTEKPIEQNHIGIGFEGIVKNDPARSAQSVITSVIGGGMSSRLFQSVREKYGLAYNICSQFVSYADAGVFSIYTALSPSSEERALKTIREELDKIKKDGITGDELDRAKELIKSSIILDMEGTSAKMKLLARNEIYGENRSEESMLRDINAVSLNDIRDYAKRVLDYSGVSISVVGKTKSEKFYKGFFE